ncbi:hypothetical protein MY04_1828 [Flammeovirga sp. MY04]|uniref:hypothetical protein n=1 Tax=Flammeovirga sp. MY04 TaxID=1191459 RepID=UPI0008268B72|nr:hypothetical protein [Flammeovirga sp. MY04]ANQ49202.2 hypothetical protein MY04_1828 [Flammeovirga sp. MY04]
MNRKQFLSTLWSKYLKPVFHLIIIMMALKMIFSESFFNGLSTFSSMAFLLLIGTVTIFLIYYPFTFLGKLIYNKTPKKYRIVWDSLSKIVYYLTLLGALLFAFYNWENDQYGTISLLVIILIQTFIESRDKRKEGMKI